MNYPNYYTRFEKFSLWLTSKPDIVASIFMSAVLFVIQSVSFGAIAVGSGRGGHILSASGPVALSSVFTAVIVGILFLILLPYSRKRFDNRIGLETTARERVDLVAWLRTGVKPESERLEPVLQKYLDFVTPIANGQNLLGQRSKGFSIVLFAFYALGLLFFIFVLLTDPMERVKAYYYIDVVLFAYFAYALNPWSKKKRMFMFLNRRRLSQIADRQRELSA